MLARMYVRWAEKKGYKVELQSETPGEEAGIKSAAYKISGPNAYGWLKSESGVHRLVRISARLIVPPSVIHRSPPCEGLSGCR